MYIYKMHPSAHEHFLTEKLRLASIVCLFLWGISTLVVVPACNANEYDSSIIKEALAGTVCDRNLAVIVEGAYFQNSKLNQPKIKPARHFESKNLKKSFRYIDKERKKVLNAALEAGPDPEMRTRTLFHFGMMIHTINSLYRNTNYLANKIQEAKRVNVSGTVKDPYSIDLVDWSKITSKQTGSLEWISPKPRNKLLKKKIGSTTYAKVARGLAIRETLRQWDFLEALIRSRYSKSADTIIAALKQAGCDRTVPQELEGLPLHAHADR